MASSASLSVTVAHAIAYLTRGLSAICSQTAIARFELVLEANLMAHYAPSWVPSEPLRGSGRRCLTFSPNALPPRPIHNACASANVKWSEWINALGGVEFDLFVDPGCVSLRFANAQGAAGKFFTVWSEELAAEAKLKAQKAAAEARLRAHLEAQQLLEDDQDEEDALFARIAQEVRAPTFKTPTTDRFPHHLAVNVHVPARRSAVSPAISTHSRSSSCSSVSSSGFSFSSVDSYDSDTTVSSASSSSTAGSKQSRRERARQQRVYVDASKKEVTPYDGGKTTVLTGGVMLGAKATPAHRRTGSSAAVNWRALRA
jgi:hypothetical protein